MARSVSIAVALSAALIMAGSVGNVAAQTPDAKSAAPAKAAAKPAAVKDGVAKDGEAKKADVKKAADTKGAKCVKAGGEANMVTQDLAEFMAKAALKNSIAGMGAKPSGQVKLKCNQNGALQYCKAEQTACK